MWGEVDDVKRFTQKGEKCNEGRNSANRAAKIT